MNQKLLATYVEQQGEINQRRATELENLERQALLKQQDEQQISATASPEVTETVLSNSSPVSQPLEGSISPEKTH